MHQFAEVFKQENCKVETIVENGLRILLAIYGAPKTELSIENFRYMTFAKLTRLNTAVKLSSLPPTAAAACQHLSRVYYQVQNWLGNNLNPEQWGWTIINNILEPLKTLLPAAPDVLLNTIFCNCTKGCNTNCGCRKVGLSCSILCGHCHGQSCLNTNVDSSAIKEIIQDEEDEELDLVELLTQDIEEKENVGEDDENLEEGTKDENLEEMTEDEDVEEGTDFENEDEL